MKEEQKMKNIKISVRHHEILKKYCNKGGLKIHKVVEKWIDEFCKTKNKDIYDE
jgi:hypothetical protein